jgi:ribokinase
MMKQAQIDAPSLARILSGLVEERAGRSDVAVVGSMNADYTVEVDAMPRPEETIFSGPMAIHPGGKSANQASSCAHLGQRTHMLGAVGDDANADMLTDELAKAGVMTSGIERVEGPSGSTVIVVDRHGENFVVVSRGANASVTPAYVRRHKDVIVSAAVLGLCLESPMDTVVEAAEIAAAAGTRVILNISPMPSQRDAVALERLIGLADVIIMNEHETAQFLGRDSAIDIDDDWNAVRRELAGKGLHHVVVTLGGQGSVVMTGDGDRAGDGMMSDGDDDGIVHVPAVSVTPVDTTGAGDSFMGATLAGLAHGNALVDACRLASVVAAYATTGRGAQSSYGNAKQVLDLVRGR